MTSSSIGRTSATQPAKHKHEECPGETQLPDNNREEEIHGGEGPGQIRDRVNCEILKC